MQMKKLTRSTPAEGREMMRKRRSSSWVTAEPELEAAYQLIQLSEDHHNHSRSCNSGVRHYMSSSSTSTNPCSSDANLVIMMAVPSHGFNEAAAAAAAAVSTTTTTTTTTDAANCSDVADAAVDHDRDISSSSSSSSLLSASSSSSSSRSTTPGDMMRSMSMGKSFDVWKEVDDHAASLLIRRKRKFRSIADLYATNMTKPNLVAS